MAFDLDVLQNESNVDAFPDPRGMRIEYIARQGEEELLKDLNMGFQPVVRKDMVDVSQAYVARVPIKQLWPDFMKDNEIDGYYDEITGLLLTKNCEMDTWARVPDTFRKAVSKSMITAIKRGQSYIGVVSNGILGVFGVSASACDVMKQFSGKSITTKLMKRFSGVALGIVQDVTDARIESENSFA